MRSCEARAADDDRTETQLAYEIVDESPNPKLSLRLVVKSDHSLELRARVVHDWMLGEPWVGSWRRRDWNPRRISTEWRQSRRSGPRTGRQVIAGRPEPPRDVTLRQPAARCVPGPWRRGS